MIQIKAGSVRTGLYCFLLAATWLSGPSARAATHYVWLNSPNPAPPYTNWARAAHVIQHAVDVAVAGDLVLVTNGVYQTGGKVVYGAMTNRVAVTKALTVQSVNGPGVTTILGYQVPGTRYGNEAIRCVYLADGAILSGFTLTNGATLAGGDEAQEQGGGGVWCASLNATVTNCVLSGNSAAYLGGGAYQGTLNNCALSGNLASSGGGAYQGTLNNCALSGNSAYINGGGVCSGMLNNCTVSSNSAGQGGGGAFQGTLNDCTLSDNSASSGGGASSATLNNCRLTGNLARSGGGACSGIMNDCTLSGNSASHRGGGAAGGTLSNCTLNANSAQYAGGGFDGVANSGKLNNCKLNGNSALYGGGAYEGALKDCTLSGNSASSSGGGACYGTLSNCTLTANSALGGGGTCNATLNDCRLGGNAASSGGGAYNGTLNNCALSGNIATNDGGGAFFGTLNNCTLSGNSARSRAGGAYGGMFNNCIVYYNSAPAGPNWYEGTLNYCCTTPLPAVGTNNLTAEPEMADVSHLSAGSPCRGAGSLAYASGVDVDGEVWLNPPAIGCDEYHSGSVTGAVSVAVAVSYTTVAAGFRVDLQGTISGRVSASRWEFEDGTVVSNRPYASGAWAEAGDHAVVLRAYSESYPSGVTATTVVHVVEQPVHYVSLSSVSPSAPYDSWATAATNIQQAVDAATVVGALVLVSNGVYQTGGKVVYGSNRVAVTKALRVQSVNGPGATAIRGYSRLGTNAVRCVYLADGAVLSGFTLTNGGTWTYPDGWQELYGGGVRCASANATVTNCVLSGNGADYGGGGAAFGTLDNCRLIGNSAGRGGGTYYCTLHNCTVTGNSASIGGGAYYGTLYNCTVTRNSASSSGGGVSGGTLYNCVVYYNSAPTGTNWSEGSLNYCCTIPLPSGSGNITNAPLFVNQVGGDLHLLANSPCINVGNNDAVPGGVDLDGKPRVVGGIVDLGAYESSVGLAMFTAWGWVTNAWQLQFLSETGKVFDFCASTDLTNWVRLTTLTNQTGQLLYTDTTATNCPLRFYRAVQVP